VRARTRPWLAPCDGRGAAGELPVLLGGSGPRASLRSVRISDWIITSGDVSAAAAVVAALVFLCAAGAAIWQVNEARRLRRAQVRPFVIVDLDTPTSQMLYISISNIGAVQARNVRVKFKPPLRSSLDHHQSRAPITDGKILRDGIEYLAPGKRHRIFWDFAHGRWNKDNQPKQGLPDRYEITVDYESDIDGDKRSFHETSAIDLGVYRDVRFGGEEGLPELVKQTTEIARTLRSWTSMFPTGITTVSGDLPRQPRVEPLTENDAAANQDATE
jgi:hypothetical protein